MDGKAMKVELKKLLGAVLLCICFCLVIAAGVALLLRTPLLAGMRAYLFRLFILEGVCCVLLLAAAVILGAKGKTVFGQGMSSAVICIAFSAAFMALFFSLGPMTIERSYTVYTLADLTDHADKTYTSEEIKDNFIEGFIEGFNESQRRIDEQVSVGNVEEVEGGYRITKKGEGLIRLYRFIEKIYPVPLEHSIYPNGH